MPLVEAYWKDTLLCDYENVIAIAENITIEELKNNKKYSNRVLRTYLNDFDLRESLLERIFNDKDKLKEFLLVEEFTNGTLQNIVGKVMEIHLTKSQLDEVTKQGHKKSKEYSKYDKFAGIIYLYQKDPLILTTIQLLEKVNKRSQSKFEMEIENFEDFKNRIKDNANLEKDLELFDNNAGDSRKSRFIGWFDIEDDIYVYFIREYKRSMTFKIENPRFDTVCEWIIFRIPNESNQIRVSYESKMDINKFIPTIISGWRKGSVASEKDIVKKFEKLNTKENVRNFLETIIKDETFPLVEIRLDPAPFKEAPVFTISEKKNKSLKSTIIWFEENNKDLLNEISAIVECKIYFNKHRLKIKFKNKEEGIAIKYSDNTLQIDLRNEFEQYMYEKFNLSVIPGV